MINFVLLFLKNLFMKRKFTFLLFIFVTLSFNLSSQIILQSDFETWTGGMPNGWGGVQTNIGAGNAAQYTTSVHGGTSACQLINTLTSHRRFSTTALPIIATQSYDVTFWVRGQGDIRTGLYNGVNAAENVYQPYINVNSTTWTMYKQTLISNQTNNNGEFIISLRNTNVANDHLQIDNVKIELSTTSVDTVTIYEIQNTSAPTGDSPLAGQTVFTKGIVTGFFAAGFFIQDGTGPWNGIYVHNNTNVVAVGDSIMLSANVTEYFNNTQLTQVTVFQKLGTGTLPQPAVITTTMVNTEPYEGVLVRVNNATCTNADAGFGMWEVNDGSGACKIDNSIFSFTPTLNTKYDITGPVNFSFSEFKIEPRSAQDVTISTSIDDTEQNIVKIHPNPTTNFVTITTTPNSQISIMNIIGKEIYSTKTSQLETLIDVSNWNAGIYIVNLKNENNHKKSYKLIKK